MSNKNRRQALKSMVVGGGAVVAGKSLPEQWTKPIVNSVLLPAHAAASCTSCLVAATYCEGSGQGSITVTVAIDGSVVIVHSLGTSNTSIDPCTGGSYQAVYLSPGGNTVTLSGTIPCGAVSSIDMTADDGQNPPTVITLTQGNCP